MAVNRCVCLNIPFEELLDLHTREGLTLDELIERTGCCTGCTTCEPYVRLTLVTGKTDHPVLGPREIARLTGRHAAG